MNDWTKDEVTYLRENTHKTAFEISKRLGRSPSAVREKARFMRLVINKRKQLPKYTEDEDLFIASAYIQASDAEIGRELGRTRKSVKSRRAMLGLFRQPRYVIVGYSEKLGRVRFKSMYHAAQEGFDDSKELKEAVASNGEYAGYRWNWEAA